MNTDNIWLITNTQESIPKSSAGTGTITSNNNGEQIIGIGTLFTKECRLNDYIYIKGQNEFAKIVDIRSDTELYLYRPFTTPLAGSAFNVTPYSSYHEISVYVDGASQVLIDNVPFSQYETYVQKGRYKSFSTVPVDVDATGTEVKVSVMF